MVRIEDVRMKGEGEDEEESAEKVRRWLVIYLIVMY